MKLYEFVDQAITAYMSSYSYDISEKANDALVDVTDLVQSSSIGDIEVAEEN
jgi:hypothetical protein